MPAIFGVVGSNDKTMQGQMAGRLARRGGSKQVWSLDQNVHFGQIRNGNLKGESPSEESVIIDGFLVNVEELSQLLPVRDQSKPAHIESLIRLLYDEYGPEIFEKFNGHFVLALWDFKRKCLVLARDRFGVIPLFYTRSGPIRLFATECKGLLAVDEIPAIPDRSSIQYFQYTGWVPRGRSFLDKILSVPAGSFVELFENGDRNQQFNLLDANIRNGSSQRQIESVRQGFREATERYSTVSKSVGVALSSGVDSSYLLAVAQQVMPESTIHSFAVGYGKDDPELQGAAITADELKSEHHELIISPEQLVDLLPETIWHLEDPVGRDQYPCVLALSKLASKFVDTLYFGNGADQLFGGLLIHPWLYNAKKFPFLKRPFEDYLSYMKSSDRPKTNLGRIITRYLGEPALPAPARVLQVPQESNRVVLQQTDVPHTLQACLNRDIINSEGNAGWKYQLVASSAGLDVRMPFYDEQLITLARTLPDGFKNRWFRGKYGLRRASSNLLSSEITWRPKRIQHLRFDHKFSEVLDSWADSLLTPDIVRSRGLFDPSEIIRIRRSNYKRPYTPKHLYRLWYLIATEIWARMFLDKRGELPSNFSSVASFNGRCNES